MLKFLVLTSYLLVRLTLTLVSSFAMLVVLKKSIYQEFDLCTYINFELPSSFLYALYELLEE